MGKELLKAIVVSFGLFILMALCYEVSVWWNP